MLVFFATVPAHCGTVEKRKGMAVIHSAASREEVFFLLPCKVVAYGSQKKGGKQIFAMMAAKGKRGKLKGLFVCTCHAE